MHRFFAPLLLAACAHCAWADGLKDLENFMRNARSGQAEFTQTVTTPAKVDESPRTKQSSGSFAFQRPGRFSFVYRKPFAQTIVADGTTLWLYDADLNQVTQRAQEQALGATPAALLASAPDLAALRAEFTLENAPERDGLQWVLATPKAEGGTLKSVQVGFAQGQLAALEIADSFGQQSRIRFSGLQLNPSLPANTFRFTPPAGADVLRP